METGLMKMMEASPSVELLSLGGRRSVSESGFKQGSERRHDFVPVNQTEGSR